MKSIWQRCHERAEMIGRKNNMYLRTRGPAPSASPRACRDGHVLPPPLHHHPPHHPSTPSPSSLPAGRHTDISELSPVPRLSNNFKSPPKKKNPARIKGRVDHSSLPSLRNALQGNNSRRRKTKSGSHPRSHTLSCRGGKKGKSGSVPRRTRGEHFFHHRG